MEELLKEHARVLKKLSNGKIKCTYTGHEMKADVDVVRSHLQSRKFRIQAEYRTFDMEKYEGSIIPSLKSDKKVYCLACKMELNKMAEEVERHRAGKRCTRKRAIFAEAQQKKAERREEHRRKKQERLLARGESNDDDDDEYDDEEEGENDGERGSGDEEGKDINGLENVTEIPFEDDEDDGEGGNGDDSDEVPQLIEDEEDTNTQGHTAQVGDKRRKGGSGKKERRKRRRKQ